jgi:hypothetical protein
LSSFSNPTLNWFKITVSLRSEIHCHISVCDDGFILATRKARQKNDPRSQTEQRFAVARFQKDCTNSWEMHSELHRLSQSHYS